MRREQLVDLVATENVVLRLVCGDEPKPGFGVGGVVENAAQDLEDGSDTYE